MVWGIVVWVWGVGCRFHSSGFGVCDLGFTVLGCRVYGSVFGAWAVMFKVQSLRCIARCLGFRDWDHS